MTEPYAQNVATSAADAAAIKPRAEFRVFAQQVIDLVQEKMWDAGATLQKARRMPPELYFISRHASGANLKVRDDLLDIKLKTGETPEGYEIFQPSGKLKFPLTPADLATLFGHLKVAPPPAGTGGSLQEVVAMARAHADIVPVSVEKMRYGFTVNGVICEYARVWFNGARVDTACCESEDYASMKKVIDLLGIAAMPNTSYIRAAQRIVGMI